MCQVQNRLNSRQNFTVAFQVKLTKFFVKRKLFNFSTKQTTLVNEKNGILLPKLFWPTVRRKCSSDQEKLLKFEAEGREFAVYSNSERSEQFLVTECFFNLFLEVSYT